MSGLKITQFGTGADPGVAVAASSAASSAVAAHEADTTDAHNASAISIADAGGYFTGTNVEAALQEIGAAPSGSLEVKEADGSPDVTGVTKIVLPNGSLTDDTGGQVTITFPGGGGVTVQDEGTPLATTADTLNFAGAGVTATGSGTTKTITIPGGGGSDVVNVATGAGSVTIPGLKGSPDQVPASPNGADEEFDAALSGSWTTIGSLDVSNANSDLASHYHVKKNATGAMQIHGLYKTQPAMPYTVVTKLVAERFDANFQTNALLLTDGTKILIFGLTHLNGGIDIHYSIWTNRTTRVSYSDSGIGGNRAPMYLKLVVNSSTSVDMYYSGDGLIWSTKATAVNPGMTLSGIGFGLTGHDNSVACEAYFDYLRFS